MKKYKYINGIKHVWVEGGTERLGRFGGNWERYYDKKQMESEIRKNQDIVFHKDGFIMAYSAGH